MAFSIQTNVNPVQAQHNLKMANVNQFQTISRLSSATRIRQSGDDAAGSAVANHFQNPAAVVTISDEAKQKLAEYKLGTINNVADAQQAKTAYGKDAAVAQETANFAQQQTRQQAGAAMLTQAQGIHSLLRGE